MNQCFRIVLRANCYQRILKRLAPYENQYDFHPVFLFADKTNLKHARIQEGLNGVRLKSVITKI